VRQGRRADCGAGRSVRERAERIVIEAVRRRRIPRHDSRPRGSQPVEWIVRGRVQDRSFVVRIAIPIVLMRRREALEVLRGLPG